MRFPLGRRGSIIGTPGQGTHSFSADPNNWESDEAYDIGVPAGTPVYAIEGGTIGSQIGSLNSSDPRMEGLRLHLQVAGDEFYYAHLSRLSVHAGEHVNAGDLLGYSGSAAGVEHLHLAERAGYPSAHPPILYRLLYGTSEGSQASAGGGGILA